MDVLITIGGYAVLYVLLVGAVLGGYAVLYVLLVWAVLGVVGWWRWIRAWVQQGRRK